jgi:hypothetical protein
MTVLRCTAMTKNGEPCEAFANGSRLFCASHDPERRWRDRQWSLPRLQQKRSELQQRRANLLATLEFKIAVLDVKIAEIEAETKP